MGGSVVATLEGGTGALAAVLVVRVLGYETGTLVEIGRPGVPGPSGGAGAGSFSSGGPGLGSGARPSGGTRPRPGVTLGDAVKGVPAGPSAASGSFFFGLIQVSVRPKLLLRLLQYRGKPGPPTWSTPSVGTCPRPDRVCFAGAWP